MNPNSPRYDFKSNKGSRKSSQAPILALETSGKSASVAIAWPDGKIEEASTDPSIGSARTLAPAIQAILKLHSLEATDLVAIGVTVGPGSFTGLRVGVATAKSIAYALHIPTIGIDSLETIAAETSRLLALENSNSDCEPTMVWTVMDAYRGQLFAALWLQHPAEFDSPLGKSQEILASHLVDSSQWEEAILLGSSLASLELPIIPTLTRGVPVVLTGPGIVRCPRLLSAPPNSGFRILNGVVPRAGIVAQIARRKLQQNQTTDPFCLMPVYLRGSAAEEKLQP